MRNLEREREILQRKSRLVPMLNLADAGTYASMALEARGCATFCMQHASFAAMKKVFQVQVGCSKSDLLINASCTSNV